MKFNCNKRSEKHAIKRRQRQQWHDYFAWFPVKVASNDCRWLEVVRRKGSYYWGDWSWEYEAK